MASSVLEYGPDRDLLYNEAAMGREILKAVDLIEHSAYVLSTATRRPYHLHGHEMPFSRPVTDYTFFQREWKTKTEVACRTNPSDRGLAISPVQISCILYGLRQNYFDKTIDGQPTVGWYLDPEIVYRECLYGVFQQFEQAYVNAGQNPIGLQSRGNNLLANVAIVFAQYMQTNYRSSVGPFLPIVVDQP